MKTFIGLLVCLVLLARAPFMRAAAPVAPEISHSLLGVTDDTVEQGEPLRVVVRLSVPRETGGVIKLAPAVGAWSDGIAVEIASAGGGPVLARAEPVGRPDSPTAELDAGHVAGGLWRIPPAAMERLTPGDYVVRARLVMGSGRGWTGEAVADELALQVVGPAQSAERVTQATANRAQDALLLGNIEQAARLLDALLVKTPDDPQLLVVRAEVALRAGNPMSALFCLNRMKSWSGSGQPDIEREELLAKARTALLVTDGSNANPPAWSWPPAEIMKPTQEQEAVLQKALHAGNPATPNPLSSPPVAAVRPTNTAPIAVAGTATASPPPPAPAAASMPPAASTSGALVPASELVDAKVIADREGQWAASARASSQYGTPSYSAARAVGAPNIPLGMAGDNQDAWCPAAKNEGTAWIELAFATPVHAREVRVRQNNAPGAMAKVELIEPDGTSHLVWTGIDPFVAPAVREIAWFAIRVPRTTYLVAKVKLTLNLAAVPGWKQIDAVQLVGTAD